MSTKDEEVFKNQSDRMDYAFNHTRENFLPLIGKNAKTAYSYLKLSQSTFSAYRNGSEPSSLVLRKLAEPCGFSVHWLVTGEGEPFFDDISKQHQVAHVTDSQNKISIGKDILSTLNFDELRFDTVINNDMTNIANAGSTVLVDISDKAENGLMMVEYKKQRLIRRIQTNSPTELLLISDTTENQLVNKEELTILGRVVWRAGQP